MTFELKALVGASLSEEAIREVNDAMAVLTKEKMEFPLNLAKTMLQRHLFDAVPARNFDDEAA